MYLRNVILVALVLTAAAFAQPTLPAAPANGFAYALLDGPVQVHYFANPNVGDSYINIENDGANGDELLGPGAGSAGYICVNVYAFDATDEQLVACCSCPISPNAVASLKLSAITSKTLTGFTPTSSTVKLVATEPAAGFGSAVCTNSAENLFAGPGMLVDGMVAWGTTITPGVASGAFVTVETQFVPVTPGTGASTGNYDLASLAERCAGIIGNGSGSGVCPGCATGALGAQSLGQ